MRKVLAISLLAFTSNLSAQDFPSEETLGEMVRDTSVEVLSDNEAILYINAGNIAEAKRSLCSNLGANLIVLQWLAKYAPEIESNMLEKSAAHIANSSNGCEFSKETKLFLDEYK